MENNYKSIFKGTMLFGGVQVFQIIISFLRNKLNAVYLGPEGLGIYGLYNSSLVIIITIATMGFTSSAVRFIANEPEEEKKIEIVKNSRYVLLFQALIGLFITVCSSLFLSYSTFGSKDYCLPYIILSLFTFFSVLSSGASSILQGKQVTKPIAKGNVLASAIALLISIPILYFMRLKAIIPVLILMPFFSFLFFNSSINKLLKNREVTVSKKIIWSIAKQFISYGFVITMASLVGMVADYCINIFVSRTGAVSDIGYYNSGMGLTYQCIGLVFNAMMMDYSPKLTSVCEDREKANALINQQGVVTLLLSVPILCVMMIASPILIRVFLSEQFLPITGFIQIIVFGMLFKSISFCLGCVSFARGDKKIFFFYEGIYGTAQRTILSIVGYKLDGLNGLAWAFVLNFIIYLITVFILCARRYKFSASKEFISITLLSLVASLMIFILTRFSTLYSIILQCCIAALISVLYIIRLEKCIGIIATIKNKFCKRV